MNFIKINSSPYCLQLWPRSQDQFLRGGIISNANMFWAYHKIFLRWNNKGLGYNYRQYGTWNYQVTHMQYYLNSLLVLVSAWCTFNITIFGSFQFLQLLLNFLFHLHYFSWLFILWENNWWTNSIQIFCLGLEWLFRD